MLHNKFGNYNDFKLLRIQCSIVNLLPLLAEDGHLCEAELKIYRQFMYHNNIKHEPHQDIQILVILKPVKQIGNC